MTFEEQLRQYFGTSDIAAIAPGAMAAGTERMQVDLGLQRDPGRRFALWALMHMLGAAPELEATFTDPAEREAARDFMDMAERDAH